MEEEKNHSGLYTGNIWHGKQVGSLKQMGMSKKRTF